MAIKFCCPKCKKGFSVRNEHAGRRAKCPCGAIIVVPRHKMSKAVTYIVDEVHSQLPFFLVYRIAQTSTLESSIQRAMASESEVILAKLLVTEPWFHVYQQLTFTNRRIIVLTVIARPWGWDGVWRILRIIEQIPGIGWVLAIPLDWFKSFFDHLFKRRYRHAYRLNAVANEAILSVEKLPKKVEKRITASSVPYTKIVQPSLGVTIRRRWLAFRLTKIRGTTLRFIPVGRLRSAVNGFLDVADYLLPNQLSVDKLVPVIRALKPHIPSTEINLTETKNSVSFRWPANIGIGDKLRSVRRANILSIVLVAITLFLFVAAFVSQEELIWLLAAIFVFTTIQTLAVRRFEEAVVVVIFIALIIIFSSLKGFAEII